MRLRLFYALKLRESPLDGGVDEDEVAGAWPFRGGELDLALGMTTSDILSISITTAGKAFVVCAACL